MGLIVESIFQIIRQRQAIASYLRMVTQSTGYEPPVGPGAQGKSYGNPYTGNTRSIGQTRYPHKHPTAHVGGFGTECRNPRS